MVSDGLRPPDETLQAGVAVDFGVFVGVGGGLVSVGVSVMVGVCEGVCVFDGVNVKLWV